MIYFNNAATTFPKFPSVIKNMSEALKRGVAFGNRDSVDFIKAEEQVYNLRSKLATLFGDSSGGNKIAFTANDTMALNIILHSIRADIVFSSDMEHNSVMRPLRKFIADGKIKKLVNIHTYGMSDTDILDEIHTLIKKNAGAKMVAVFTHASNVTGDVLPAKEMGHLFVEYNIPFILDVAQSAGIVPIDVLDWHVSALAFAGHKALGGPQGTGGMYVNGLNLKPLLFGGTGNASSSLNPPIVYPDSFEVGTPATHDLVGLATAIDELEKIGLEEYSKKICDLTQRVHDGLKKIKGVHVYGNPEKRSSAVSFTMQKHSCKEIGSILGEHEIVCRTGAHCSAVAMRTIGASDGTVRISCGYFNTNEEVDILLDVLKKI